MKSELPEMRDVNLGGTVESERQSCDVASRLEYGPDFLEKYLEQSDKVEKVPDLEIKYFFGRHATTEDAMAIKPYLDDADIFIVEGVSSKGVFINKLQDIASGENRIQPDGLLTSSDGTSFFDGLFKIVLDSKMPIGNVDIQSDDIDNYDKEEQIITNLEEMVFIDSDTLDVAATKYLEVMHRRSEQNYRRERLMRMRMAPEIERILEQNPSLQNKARLNILVFLGGSHYRMEQHTKDILHSNTTSVNASVFSDLENLYHRVEIGREKIETREEQRDLFLEKILEDLLGFLVYKFKGATDIERYITSILKVLSTEEEDALYNLFRKDKREALEYLRGIMEENDIPLYVTEEERQRYVDNLQLTTNNKCV